MFHACKHFIPWGCQYRRLVDHVRDSVQIQRVQKAFGSEDINQLELHFRDQPTRSSSSAVVFSFFTTQAVLTQLILIRHTRARTQRQTVLAQKGCRSAEAHTPLKQSRPY